MFVRPCTQQEWLADSTIAGKAPAPLTISNVVFPRRVERQQSHGHVKALKALMRDAVALRPDWNLFGDDSDMPAPAQAKRRPSPRRDLRQILCARRDGLQAWVDRKTAERDALRRTIEAKHQAMFAEDEALRSTLTFVDEADKPEPPSAAMQLAAHLISVALIAVALPLGVMALVCTILRGGDIRIAARMSTLTGFAVMALSQNSSLLSALAS